jgi:hypothetical protein
MIAWALPLAAGAAALPCAWLAVRRRRPDPPAARVGANELGLERLPRLGALVQFSCYACHPCRVSLNRLAMAAAHAGEDVVVVELPLDRSGRLARRLEVERAPTVLLVDARGRVLRRWAAPPERADLERSLLGYETVATGSTSKLRA